MVIWVWDKLKLHVCRFYQKLESFLFPKFYGLFIIDEQSFACELY